MGRLVDIDEVIRIAENTFPQEDVRKIMWVLCHTPTAYDVEKVVAELEDLEEDFCQCFEKCEEQCFIQRVTDIVKRGGVE